MDCPRNSWIWIMVLEKWAAFDASYQSFGTWNMALDFQCFFEAFSGDLLAQSGDGAPARGYYPSTLSNFFTDQPFLFGDSSS